jgi:DNA-binding Lrp family transcriptional regulator
MSLQVLNYVFQYSQATGSRRLVMIVLANGADENGETILAISTIAAAVKLKSRAVQRILRDLEASGEIVIIPCDGMVMRAGQTNRYIIPFSETVMDRALERKAAKEAEIKRRPKLRIHDEGVNEDAPLELPGENVNKCQHRTGKR